MRFFYKWTKEKRTEFDRKFDWFNLGSRNQGKRIRIVADFNKKEFKYVGNRVVFLSQKHGYVRCTAKNYFIKFGYAKG